MTSYITLKTLCAKQPQAHAKPNPRVEVELTSDLVNSQLIDDLLAFALDTIGARVLDVRVLDHRPLPCWPGPSG